VEHHDLPWLATFLLSSDALLVLVGSRLYVVVALGPQAERDDSARERFFHSFEVWEP